MPNMGFRGIYAASNSSLGGRLPSGEYLAAARGGLLPTLDFNYLNPGDTYYPYTTLLVKAIGANTAQNSTIIDSSPNNVTITRNGDVSQGQFSPYSLANGYWGNYFDGVGDFLTLSPGSSFAFGTGDFTVELWYNPTSAASSEYLIENRTSGQTTGVWSLVYNWTGSNSGTLYWYNGSTTLAQASGSTVTSQWNHIVYVRSGTTGSLYINGTRVATQTDSTNYSNNPVETRIGARYSVSSNDQYVKGNISNLRVIKGTAAYDPTQSTLSTPVSALTAVTNTVLLTCQSNRFIDNSTNAFAITKNGDTKVVAYSPFNLSLEYGSTYNSGSLYFDGTGDTLTIASSTNNQFGSGDFTIETWYYCSGSISTSAQHLFFRRTTTAAIGMILQVDSSKLNLLVGDSTIQAPWDVNIASSSTLVAGTWYHLAASRSGSTWKIFINGVEEGSATASLTIAEESANITVGTSITGYLSNWRVVKGTAVYTSAFTPPSTPLTAISGTGLLLSGTNASIIDGSRKNNLNTVGNAQVRTNIFKYSKSMYFDGSGDYVNLPSDPLLNFGTSNFTIECWVYANSNSNLYPTIIGNVTGWTTGSAGCRFNNTGLANKFSFHLNGAGDPFLTSTNTFSTGTWYHYALTRSGNTFRLFINGNLEASSSAYSGSLNMGFGGTNIGWSAWDGNNGYFNGYIEDLRITNGYARYTSNFTPPEVLTTR